MYHTKLTVTGALGAALLFAVGAYAQSSFDFDGITSILTDNKLDEAANRYSSVLLSFDPEQASRLGFSSSYDRLTSRSPQQTSQFLTSLRALRETVEQFSLKQLSPSKQVDRELLLSSIDTAIWQAEQNPSRTNPLYYAQALDSVYDLVAKPLASAPRQRAALAARLSALPAIAEQAQAYLQAPAPILAQIAMSKAYYAYLSADEWNDSLASGTQDEQVIADNKRIVENAKKAVKKMFDQFKELSKLESAQDARIGAQAYFTVLQSHYQWQKQSSGQLFKELENEVNTSQKALTQALAPFLEQIEEENEVTVVDEVNQPQTEEIQPAKKAKKKKKSKNLPPSTAQDFYVVAKLIQHAPADDTPLQTLMQEANNTLTWLTNQGVLPKRDVFFAISALPQYYAYVRPFLFLPPFGDQLSPRADFLLRIPSGNAQTKQEQFDQDFNAPTRKLMIASELVPGRFFQAQCTLQNDSIRRLYPSASMQNGWAAYARHLAKRSGYLNTPEDEVFFAWDEYQRALAAWVEAKLHTRQYTYDQAKEFLTQTHGFSEENAAAVINQVIAYPGETVSFHIGLKALEEAHQKFSKKQGKKFSEADFNAKLFQVGNVPPHRLLEELHRVYDLESKLKKQRALF